MEVNRKGNEITIVFDTESEAQGITAFLSGTAHEVPPEVAQKGQWLYTWFFNSVQKLAHNFIQESSVKTMSPENLQGPVPTNTSVNTSKKGKKR